MPMTPLTPYHYHCESTLRLDLGSRLCDLHASGLNVNLETIDRLQQLEGVRWQRKVLRGTWIFFVVTT